MVTAEELAEQFRAISIAEFMEKNRHLLGYENPTKALITVVKELVDNAIDASEESRILPDIKVSVKEVGLDRFKVIVEDNGPGIVPDKLPSAFGKLLYGTKFHRLKMARGQQGIGACLKGDSLIHLKDGRLKEIEDIVKNNETNAEVLSFDSGERRLIASKIIKCIKNPPTSRFVKIRTFGGLELVVTPEHLIPMKEGVRSIAKDAYAKEIRHGNYLLLALKEHDVANPHENPIPIWNLINTEKYRIYDRKIINPTFSELKRKYGRYSKIYKELDIPEERFRGWCRDRVHTSNPVVEDFFRLSSLTSSVRNFGDFVEIGNYHHKIKLPLTLNADLCWLLGLIASDGSMVKNKKKWGTLLSITNNNEVILERTRNVLSQLGLHHKEYKGVSVRFSSTILSEIANKFGIPFGKKSDKIEMTDFVLQLPNRLLSSYLRGLYDGDGSIIVEKDNDISILYSTKSEKLAKQLQLVLLTRFGIFSSFKKVGSKNKIIYQVSIASKGFIDKFIKKIGFTSHQSLTKLKKWLKVKQKGKAYFCIFDGKNWWVKVRSVKEIELPAQPTYDLTINNHPYFCANGIVVHNSGAILYSQLTTGKPAKITSSTGKDIHIFELAIDVAKNEPHVISHKIEKNKDKWHGIKFELETEGRYVEKAASVPEYLKQTAMMNPYAKIVYDGPNGKIVFDRVTKELPKPPKEIKPHPYGVELGLLRRMLQNTKSKNISSFLTSEFSRVGKRSVEQICRLSKIDPNSKPKDLTHEETERLHKAMQMVKLIAPPTDCLSPLGENLLIEGLKKETKVEYAVAVTRPPAVYRGMPFQIEVALGYGGELPTDKTSQLFRFANKVPLLYHQSDCATTEAVIETDWRRYGFSQSEGQLPVGPLVILIHFASVWVPFTSEGKQAIANYPEIIKEIKLALQDAGRKLATYVRQKNRLRERQLRQSLFEHYIPEFAESLSKLTGVQKEKIKSGLEKILKKGDVSGEETKGEDST
jgi:DNA topoisomerase VI B subunit